MCPLQLTFPDARVIFPEAYDPTVAGESRRVQNCPGGAVKSAAFDYDVLEKIE